MKVLVPVKRAVDDAKIRPKSDGTGAGPANVEMLLNRFDEIAIEEALRRGEIGKTTETNVVSIGPV